MSCFWTLNSAKYSVSSMFSDQTLHTNCSENQGSWNGSSPTRQRSLHQKLSYHYTLVTASLLFHEKTSTFRGRFREVAIVKIPPCLSLDFGVNDGALLPRLARLQTSPSPQKLLVLKVAHGFYNCCVSFNCRFTV